MFSFSHHTSGKGKTWKRKYITCNHIKENKFKCLAIPSKPATCLEASITVVGSLKCGCTMRLSTYKIWSQCQTLVSLLSPLPCISKEDWPTFMTGSSLLALAAASLCSRSFFFLRCLRRSTAAITIAIKASIPMTIPAIAPPDRPVLWLLLASLCDAALEVAAALEVEVGAEVLLATALELDDAEASELFETLK